MVVVVPFTGYLVVTGSVGTAAGFFLFNLAYVAALEYGLKPKLIGGRAHLPAVLVFLSVLGGLSLYGVLGLFYGPLIVAIFLTLVDIYESDYRPLVLARPANTPASPGAPSQGSTTAHASNVSTDRERPPPAGPDAPSG